MSGSGFEVSRFAESEFKASFLSDHLSKEEAGGHNCIGYLYSYLAAIGAQTIISERPYIDGDYLDDYAAYYAKCFVDYDRHCRRLHFFSESITNDEFALFVSSGGRGEDPFEIRLQNSYLGFVVVRPLPQAVVGRTLLRTFSDDSGRRYYPGTRNYTVNLFGCNLTLSSLAFQEQDTVLAACATVALWSSFHKASALFGTALPTPAAITRAGTQNMHNGRPFPSHGLSIQEICSSVRHSGLEPELIDLSIEPAPVLSMLYAYLAIGVPIILAVKIDGVGLHAVTVIGYSIKTNIQRREEVPGGGFVPMPGLRIDKFYAHDDQIGPFSRLEIEADTTDSEPWKGLCFRTSWLNGSGYPIPVYPRAVIVPIYTKIRLTFLDVQSWLIRLDRVLKLLFPRNLLFEWDVRLAFSNHLKAEFRKSMSISDQERRALLVQSHPRFVWQASLKSHDSVLVDVLFDATAIARSFPVYRIVWHVPTFAEAMRRSMATPSLRGPLLALLSERFIQTVEQSLVV